MTRDLVEKYHREGNLKELLTLFEVLTADRERAESLVQSHIHTIKKLHESFSKLTEPKSYVNSIPSQDNEQKKPKETKPKQILDDLDL